MGKHCQHSPSPDFSLRLERPSCSTYNLERSTYNCSIRSPIDDLEIIALISLSQETCAYQEPSTLEGCLVFAMCYSNLQHSGGNVYLALCVATAASDFAKQMVHDRTVAQVGDVQCDLQCRFLAPISSPLLSVGCIWNLTLLPWRSCI